MSKDIRFDDYQDTPFGIDQKVLLATQQFPSQNWFPGSVQQPSQCIPSSAWKHHLSAANHQFRMRSQSNCRLCLNTNQSLDCRVTAGPVRALSQALQRNLETKWNQYKERTQCSLCMCLLRSSMRNMKSSIWPERNPTLAPNKPVRGERQELGGTEIPACVSILQSCDNVDLTIKEQSMKK